MKPVGIPKFFAEYFQALEERGWPAVILHSWQEMPERIDSDVDYLISGVRPGQLLSFIDAFCMRRGWILAQVLEHEPHALYCICYMEAAPWKSLKLDVAWNYQRKGRVLLPGSFLLAGRRKAPGKPFHVPAPRAEFAYLMAKALAKAKGAELVMNRLEALWEEDPTGCAETLVERFGMKRDEAPGAFPNRWLTAALQPDNPAFRRWRSRRWGPSQMTWLARRLRYPRGLTISVGPSVDPGRLAEILQACFRRYAVVDSPPPPGPWRRLWMRYRTGLLVAGSGCSLRGDILDLEKETMMDRCVARTLEHLHQRGRWSG